MPSFKKKKKTVSRKAHHRRGYFKPGDFLHWVSGTDVHSSKATRPKAHKRKAHHRNGHFKGFLDWVSGSDVHSSKVRPPSQRKEKSKKRRKSVSMSSSTKRHRHHHSMKSSTSMRHKRKTVRKHKYAPRKGRNAYQKFVKEHWHKAKAHVKEKMPQYKGELSAKKRFTISRHVMKEVAKMWRAHKGKKSTSISRKTSTSMKKRHRRKKSISISSLLSAKKSTSMKHRHRHGSTCKHSMKSSVSMRHKRKTPRKRKYAPRQGRNEYQKFVKSHWEEAKAHVKKKNKKYQGTLSKKERFSINTHIFKELGRMWRSLTN